MRARSSVTVFGDRFRRRQRWCRELKWGSIFCGRAAAGADDDVAVVEDGGLAGGDGALRGVERDARSGGVERLDGGRGGFVLVADFGEGAKRAARLITGNPAHAFNFAACLSEDIVFADHDAVLFWINRENVERLAGGEAKPLTLAYRKIVNAVVVANHVAVFVDDFTFAILQRDSALARIRLDELHVVASGHETKLHAFRLLGNWQIRAAG